MIFEIKLSNLIVLTNTLYLYKLFTIMTSSSRKRKAITLETKHEIIQSVRKGDSPKKDMTSKFGIPPNTNYNLKKKPKISLWLRMKTLQLLYLASASVHRHMFVFVYIKNAAPIHRPWFAKLFSLCITNS